METLYQINMAFGESLRGTANAMKLSEKIKVERDDQKSSHSTMPGETMRHDPAALDSLERSQLTQYSEQPLPRRPLGRGTVVMLVLLRIYVLIAIPIVAYAFVRALLGH